MDKFGQLRLYFEMMCPVESQDAAEAMSNLFDPAVTPHIELNTDPAIQQAIDYYQYVFEGGPRPAWFQKEL